MKLRVIAFLSALDKNAMINALAVTLGNLGVVGVGLGFWQAGEWSAWVGGSLCMFLSLILSGMVKK